MHPRSAIPEIRFTLSPPASAGHAYRLLVHHPAGLNSGGLQAECDTRNPHWFGPADDRPVEILSLLGNQGERIHVRASSRHKGENA